MRLRIKKRGLRAKFAPLQGLVAETSFTLHPRGRLKAKLLIFDTYKNMRAFWKKYLLTELGPRCNGVVNPLAAEVQMVNGAKVFEGDRTFFCLIGLSCQNLSGNVVTHEAVHAAFNYERRVKRNLFGKRADFDEERIAYPAGIIAQKITNFAYEKGLL